MRINPKICIGCNLCHYYCPAQAIEQKGNISVINEELCFECGTCLRTGVCPVKAIYENEEIHQYPRIVRKYFSDPAQKYPGNRDIGGRGTDEVKTNDVTGRYKKGQIGIGLEIGRPTVGARLYDLEKITMGLVQAGFDYFEPDNPVVTLMENPKTGKLKNEVLKERILSAIIEMTIPEKELERCLKLILALSKKINTVITVDLIACYDSNYDLSVQNIIDRSKFNPLYGAKINLGFGRCTNKEQGENQ